MRLLLIALFVLFFGEIYVVTWVGQRIGLMSSIALTILTGIAGLLMVRQQGWKTIVRADSDLQSGRMPIESIIHGVGLAIAGTGLFLPGFITDALGLALLVPAFRLRVGHQLISRLKKHEHLVFSAGPGAEHSTVLDLDQAMWRETSDDNDACLRAEGDRASHPALPPENDKENGQP